MTKRFPKFSSHTQVSCFNCGGDLVDGYFCESGYPKGRGQFRQECEKCRMSTWYDIKEKVGA